MLGSGGLRRPDDLVLALRTLGYRAADIAAAAARSPAPGEATIEKRVKAALRVLTPELRTVPAA